MKTFILQLIVSILVIILLTVTVFIGLGATNTGSAWLVNQLIKSYRLPISLGTFEGKLLDRWVVHDIVYDDVDTDTYLSLDKAELDWQPVRLLQRQLHIQTIALDTLNIRITSAASEAESTALPEFSLPQLPLAVFIDDIRLVDLAINTNGSDYRIDQIATSLRLDNDALAWRLENLIADKQTLNGRMDITDASKPSIDAILQWQGELENAPGTGRLTITGAQNDLLVELDTESAITIDAVGRLDLTSQLPKGNLQASLGGDLIHNYSDLLQLDSDIELKIISDGNRIDTALQTDASLKTAERFQLGIEAETVLTEPSLQQIHSNLHWHLSPEDKTNTWLAAHGQGDITYQEQTLQIQHIIQQPFYHELKGTVDIRDMTHDLVMNWRAVDYSLSDTSRLQLGKGKMSSKGGMDNLLVDLTTGYLLQTMDGEQLDEQEPDTDYSVLSLSGKLNLLSQYPTGRLTANIEATIPEALKNTVQELQPVNIDVQSGQNAIDVSITAKAIAHSGESYAWQFNSSTDMSDSVTALPTSLDWSVQKNGQTQTITGTGDIIYQANSLAIQHRSAAPYLSSLQATVPLNDEQILDVTFDWQDITLALGPELNLQQSQGSIKADGSLTSINVSSAASLQARPLGDVELALDANWSDETVTIHQLTANLLDGAVDVTGKIALQDDINAGFDIAAENLNFAAFNPGFQSALDVQSRLNLASEPTDDDADQISVSVDIDAISGSWRDNPVSGNASIDYSEDALVVDALKLRSGNNVINASLRHEQSLVGRLDLTLKDLSLLAPDLSGQIQGNLNFTGDSSAPVIAGQLKGEAIRFNQFRIDDFSTLADVDLQFQRPSSLAVSMSSLRYNDIEFDTLDFKGQGDASQHDLQLSAAGTVAELPLDIKALVRGGLGPETQASPVSRLWSGQLQQLSLNNDDVGDWQLSSPADMQWNPDKQRFLIEDSCLQQQQAMVCLSASSASDQAVTGNINLKRLPLTLARYWLPEQLSLQGYLSGKSLIKQSEQAWQMTAQLTTDEVQLTLGEGEQAEIIDIQRATLDATLTDKSRDVSLMLSADNYFDVSLTAITDDSRQSIQGNLNLGLADIAWLSRLSPALAGSYGRVQGKLFIDGNVQRPGARGDFSLQNGELHIMPLGLTLDKLNAELSSNDASQQLTARTVLGSQGKSLMLNGTARLLPDQDYAYELQLSGEQFPLMRTADVTLDISPQLLLKGSKTLHQLNGSLNVPFADIIIPSLPDNAVSLSPDTVIVDSAEGQQANPQRQNGFFQDRVAIDMDILLAPEITVQGFGLDTQLNGDFKLNKPVGVNQPRGEGQIAVVQGSYQAYGQQLEIERGLIQFAGPVDNPGLSIRAIRPGLPITAGVDVSGTIRQPKLALFSEPPQSEADTLSYVITGKPISGASSGEANLIATAALSLGAKESSVLTNEIQNLFNLDDFSVESGDSLDNTSLNASKRLSEKLVFRTSFNPFDQLWSFLLDYKITDNWSVQTTSGVTQGADIIYSIESNSFRDLYERFWGLLQF